MAASDDSDVSTGPAADHPRTPVTAWLRPVLVLLGGMAVAALLAWNDQLILAVPLALLTLLMAYWTSPLRSGPHTSLRQALEQRGDTVAIIQIGRASCRERGMDEGVRGW